MSTVLPISKIKADQRAQSRVGIDQSAVLSYQLAYEAGENMPPVEVLFDGKTYWLWDGFHRLRAVQSAGLETIAVNVQPGNLKDAILKSVGANAAHGLPRSNEDKRKAVVTLLNDPEWANKSDRWLADQARVSNHLVSSVRAELGIVPTERECKDGSKRYAKKEVVADVDSNSDAIIFGDEGSEQLASTPTGNSTGGQGCLPVDNSANRKPLPLSLFAQAVGKLNALRNEIESLLSQPGYRLYGEASGVEIMGSLLDIEQSLDNIKPHASCPHCDGEGCDMCDHDGWTTQRILNRVKG